MSAEIETRRFRTWEAGAQRRRGRAPGLIVSYLVARYVRAWYMWGIVAIGMMGAILGVYLAGFDTGPGAAPSFLVFSSGPVNFIVGAMVLYVLLVTAPTIAEDTRFNAGLFYFSKPMRARDYMVGKTAFQALGMSIVGLLPIVVMFLVLVASGPGDADAVRAYAIQDGVPASELDALVADWRARSIDTWDELLYFAGMPLLATLSVGISLTGFMMFMSSVTKRAWHAAVGGAILVMGTSIMGEMASQRIVTSDRLLYGPTGWLQAVYSFPQEHRFRRPECLPGGDDAGTSYCYDYLRTLDGAVGTITLAHLLLVGTGLFWLTLTWLRVRRLEAAA